MLILYESGHIRQIQCLFQDDYSELLLWLEKSFSGEAVFHRGLKYQANIF